MPDQTETHVVSTPGEMIAKMWEKFVWPYHVENAVSNAIEYDTPSRGCKAARQLTTWYDYPEPFTIEVVVVCRAMQDEMAQPLAYFLDSPGWSTQFSENLFDLNVAEGLYVTSVDLLHFAKADMLAAWSGVVVAEKLYISETPPSMSERSTIRIARAAQASMLRLYYTNALIMHEPEDLDDAELFWADPASWIDEPRAIQAPPDLSALVSAVKSAGDREWEYQIGYKGDVHYLRSRAITSGE